MVKVKNKKNFGQADKLHTKKSQAKSKRNLNPFEVHINKEKFKVLGKKSKNDWGLPGVSRAKALKKRKNTLGHELKLVNKTNTFLDKRIGEKNVALTEEDKIGARFTLERIQQNKMKSDKTSIYNLAEDEILTHRGQTLEEIEKFDDPRSDDEEDEEMERNQYGGNLKDGFVADANFGGGVLTRNENGRDGALSRKDLIEQLIIESKKRKLEKQKLKEETLDLTEKLDTEWKDLQPVVAKDFNKEVEKLEKSKPVEAPSLIEKLLSDYEKKNEDYDKMMRELKFEPRGTPSDRLKSEDEIAKVEKDKLEKLEQDRLARMHGTASMNKAAAKPKHRSADDLDDDFEVDSDPEMMVAYDSEGKVLNPERFEKDNDEDEESGDGENNGSDEEGSEPEDGDGSTEDKENDSGEESEADSICDLREPDQHESSSEEEETEEKETVNMKRKIPVLNISLPKNIKTNSEKDDKKETPILSISSPKKAKTETPGVLNISTLKTVTPGVTIPLISAKSKGDSSVLQSGVISSSNLKESPVPSENGESTVVNKIKADLLARKAMMEKAAAELPYTFEMPKNYEALQELLEKQPPDYQFIIVERIIKCNHPKLKEGNKAKLGTLFAYLLQYVNDLFCEESVTTEEELINAFRCFDRLSSHFFDLAQMDTTNTKNCIVEVIKEKYEEYKNKSTVFPDLDTLIFFKLISLLFPTSDLKHPVVSPCFIFMSLLLTTCKVKNNKDVAKGLFITTMVAEYTVLSKRILPAAFNFLRGLLFLPIPTLPDHQIKVLKPMKPYGPRSNLLVINKSEKINDSDCWKMLARHLISENQDNDFKTRVLVTSIKLLEDFFNQAGDLTIQCIIFEPHLDLLKRIPKVDYPESVAKQLTGLIDTMETTLKAKRFMPLVSENKRPKSLKLYEPAVEKQFNTKNRKGMSKEKIEHEKLVYKHKKEMKGALREIRRDRSFIGAYKLKDKLHSDNIRKEKVKRIYSEASEQQGELNAMQRSKKKKK